MRCASRISRAAVNAVILMAALVPGSRAAAVCEYQVTVIYAPGCPPPFPLPPTIGTGINELGHVVGYYHQCGGGSGKKAFVWRPGTGLQTLNRPAGVSSAIPIDINDGGVIVGEMTTTEYQSVGFIYDDRRWTELPPHPGGVRSSANAINNDGIVVGRRSIGPGITPYTAFLWSADSGFTELGEEWGLYSTATDINHTGQATGSIGPTLGNEAFVWEGETVQLLGPIPDGFSSVGGAINRAGHVAGVGGMVDPVTGGTVARGFFWDGADMVIIDPVPGYDTSTGRDLNDVGQVVGFGRKLDDPNDRRAFLWQSGVTHDLNALIPRGSGMVLYRAKAINNAGQIVADGVIGSFVVTFLLTPTDVGPGDINLDCQVNELDLIILIDAFGQTGVNSADVNADGVVNVLDLIIVLLNWG